MTSSHFVKKPLTLFFPTLTLLAIRKEVIPLMAKKKATKKTTKKKSTTKKKK